MFWNKACPRCKGSLVDDRDRFGYFIFCLQCGYYANEIEIESLKAPASKTAKDPAISSPQEESTALVVHSEAVVR